MLTKLTIRGFKLFDEVEIELAERVVFVGPNNSGKTSALQALALWDIGAKRWMEKRGSGTVPAQRPGVFAEAWTRLESCLKCVGLPLTEWNPRLAQQLLNCHVMGLDLPESCCGSIAMLSHELKLHLPPAVLKPVK